jgi:hypothetical protein
MAESVKSGASKFATAFPVTAQLNPLVASNWKYLLMSAIFSRIAIGLARVWENRPAKHSDPSLTQNQKRQAFLERCFVELCGTVAYIATLHIGQDLVSKLFFEGRDKLNLTVFKKDVEDAVGKSPHITPELHNQVKQSIDAVFGKNHQGIIYRNIFGDANLANLKKTIIQKAGLEAGEKAYEALKPEFVSFAKTLGRSSTSTILGGVLISAIFGGFVTQKLNDNFVAPMSRKWLNKKFKEPDVDGNMPFPGITPEFASQKVFVSEAPAWPVSMPASSLGVVPSLPSQQPTWPNGNTATPPTSLPPPGNPTNPLQTGGAYQAPLPLRMGTVGGTLWR